MKHNLTVALLIWLAVLSSSCAGGLGVGEFNVFDGGVNISRIELKKESATQLNYEVSVAYPDKRVLDFYKEQLLSTGWKGCQPESGWNKQLKKYNNQIKGVRQLISYLVHEESSRLLMISLQYHADSMSQVNSEIKWRNDTQYVMLVVYSVDGLDKVLNGLSLSCSNVES